jgi:kynurenine 3-monooxygenase
MQAVIPMRGRMIHKMNGELDSQLYDKDGQVRFTSTPVALSLNDLKCINSIDRRLLNGQLLDQASSFSNIQIHFRRKVISADFDAKIITFQDLLHETEGSVEFDLCIGADGSYSVIRRQMMRVVRCDLPFIRHFRLLTNPT